MSARQLVIAPTAKTDIKDIYQYGLRQWGQAQTDSYLENIKEHFWYRKVPSLFLLFYELQYYYRQQDS